MGGCVGWVGLEGFGVWVALRWGVFAEKLAGIRVGVATN